MLLIAPWGYCFQFFPAGQGPTVNMPTALTCTQTTHSQIYLLLAKIQQINGPEPRALGRQ